MITQLDNQQWAKELVTGNAQFIEIGGSVSPPTFGTIYVVSQVRADNTFAIFQSQPAPPTPGPGYAYTIVATYTFPFINGKNNTSFDPVIAYDSANQLLYIVGTEDSADGVNVVIFTYSTLHSTLSAPTTLTTASYIRDSYDICILGENQFVAVAVTNPSQIWQTPTVSAVTGISITGSTMTVTTNNTYLVGQKITFSGLQNALFLNGVTVTVTGSTGTQFTATYVSSPPINYTQVGYENGFATWLPGHTLLGFELDMMALSTSPPTSPFVSVTALDNSPFFYGNTFGAVSAYSPDGVNIEVYYEAHPKLVTFTDQVFNLNLASYGVSPPTWSTTTLKTFTGRYADARLTVVPVGTSRVLLQQYYSQLVHQNALIGNLLLGYYNGSTWSFQLSPGSNTTSYIQGTLSLSENYTVSPPSLSAFVSYIAEPVYSIRGEWSPQVKTYAVANRLTYNLIDYIVNTAVSYPYVGVWTALAAYKSGDVVQLAFPTHPVSYKYYTALHSISSSAVSPNLDTTNWIATLTPNLDSRFTVAPIAWPLKLSSLNLSNFNLSDLPGYYNNLNFTWLRGSKTLLDNQSSWAVVGEVSGSTTSGATYVSDFYVPPVANINPSGDVTALRGTPLLFSAAGTSDGDNETVKYTWTYSPIHSNVSLTQDSGSGATATFLATRAIGGAAYSFIVGVVAVDYNGATPLHPPMTITDISIASNVLTVTTEEPVFLATGESVFLYSLTNATFLNDLVVVVSNVSGANFTANFSHANYSAADTGFAIANAQFAFCDVTIPFNPAPTIDFTHDAYTHNLVTLPIPATRNSIVTINPTITGASDSDDQTTFTWTQTSGTTIPSSQVLTGTHTAHLQFETNGVLVQGDAIIWSLTINDGVNAPVTSSVTVDVAAFPFTQQDTLRLARSVSSGNIAQRNSILAWSPLEPSAIYTNFTNVKRTSVLDGSDRYLLISPASVCVYGGINPNLALIRKLFVPGDNPIVDAVHTEDDWTLVLDDTSNLYRYSTAPLINTDNPDTIIDLNDVTSMVFNKIFVTYSYGNTRVAILTGPDGCLLLQLRNSDLAIQGAKEMTVGSGLIYGVDNVQFVRSSNVESLHTGKILIGTIAQVVADITSVEVSSNTVTITAKNSFVGNQSVTSFSGLTHATFLNGVTALVVGTSTTQFIISFQTADYFVTNEPVGATAVTGGNTYETLIDLSHGQIIGTWDASKLKNQYVTTGEILFEPNDTYAGIPAPPLLNPVVNNGQANGQYGYASLTISWTADRPDLIQMYNLGVSFDGVNWVINPVNSGFIESVNLPEPIGQLIYFRIQAFSADGASGFSNVVSIHT